MIVIAALVAGCASGRGAYGRGERASRIGDWDAAVEYYRTAVQEQPNRAEYRIALERAMINAANVHLDQARVPLGAHPTQIVPGQHLGHGVERRRRGVDGPEVARHRGRPGQGWAPAAAAPWRRTTQCVGVMPSAAHACWYIRTASPRT